MQADRRIHEPRGLSNDDEIAVINRGESLHVFNMDNKESKVNIQKLRMSISELEKGGYPHFMLKEIFEQPARCATASAAA